MFGIAGDTGALKVVLTVNSRSADGASSVIAAR